MSPVVASTLLANVRRPEWLEPPLTQHQGLESGYTKEKSPGTSEDAHWAFGE